MKKVPAPLSWVQNLLPMHPIVYITTVSGHGNDNCGVYATCMDTSYSQPQITFAISIKQHKVSDANGEEQKESLVQDTLRNIQETGKFVINVPGIELASKMKILAYPFGSDVDEISKSGLTKLNPLIFTKKPYPKLIKECLVHIECELVLNGIYHARGSDHILVTGNVIGVSYDDSLGQDLDEIRKNLIRKVFGQLGASPNLNSRYIGRVNLYELKDTLVFEAERNKI